MTRYAARTKVPVSKSRMEIEAAVKKYGATGFGSGWMTTPGQKDRAVVQFQIAQRQVRFSLHMDPKVEERQKWRALLLVVKAKLEAVDAGIATIEQSFFAEIVHPETGQTVYEMASKQLALAYEQGTSMPLLPGVAT